MAIKLRTRFGERFDTYLLSTDLPDSALQAIEAAYAAADQIAVDAANLTNQNPHTRQLYEAGAREATLDRVAGLLADEVIA